MGGERTGRGVGEGRGAVRFSKWSNVGPDFRPRVLHAGTQQAHGTKMPEERKAAEIQTKLRSPNCSQAAPLDLHPPGTLTGPSMPGASLPSPGQWA